MKPSSKSAVRSTGDNIIEAHGLIKKYGDVVALDGLDLTVPEGTILGLLGPNGAGKTTAVSILTTLLKPDSGSATVAGADVATSPGEVRKHIGLSGQYAAVDRNLQWRAKPRTLGSCGGSVGDCRAGGHAFGHPEPLQRWDLHVGLERTAAVYVHEGR